jgi:hypothetical protein
VPVLVGNDQIGVDVLLDAEPAAGGTRAERMLNENSRGSISGW